MELDIFKELVESRNKFIDHELTNEENEKLIGNCLPGCRVEIHWCKECDGIIDYGYVFAVDGMDADLGDCFVHVPEQDNSSGKDKGEPSWNYMIELLNNPYCKKIICK